MGLPFFSTQPPLDDDSVNWIFEVFDWGLQHLGREVFEQHSALITPSNEHFPGRSNSSAEMAALMFERTLRYAGVQDWPFRLVPPGTPIPSQLPTIVAPSPLRRGDTGSDTGTGTAVQIQQPGDSDGIIPVSYNPGMINNPEAMIAGFAQVFAHYLGAAVREPPPGGIQNWPQTTDVLGVFLGFGVMFANTAYQYQPRSCASCSGPPVERQVNLAQYDVTYALALFCVLKDIPSRQVLKSLKGALRGYFKRCRRDVEKRPEQLALLARPVSPQLTGVAV